MYRDGNWKLELKRNGRIIKLAFSNLILNDAVNFNFAYAVNNEHDSIITHMFLGSTHGVVKPTDTTMSGGLPFAAVPYTDYIKPNFDNPLATIFENELVFKYTPTETVVIRQIATGRITNPTTPTYRYFSVANLKDENGEPTELEVKPGDILTFRYVLTMVGHFMEFDAGFYSQAMLTKADFNNLMKANPNWGLAGIQRHLNILAPLVSDHLGVAVTGSYSFVINYGTTSAVTGEPYTGFMYNITWTTVDGSSMSGIAASKFNKEFYASLMFPWTKDQSGKTAPAGASWTYTQLFYITNGLTAVDRFDHTKMAPLDKPKLPTSFSYKLLDANYYYGMDANTFASWELNIAGAEPLSQLIIVQNNQLVLPNTSKLLFVNKDGTFKDTFKITNLKRDIPFFIHFYNKTGKVKYGPLFVTDNKSSLRGSIEQPVINKGADLSTRYYPSGSYYASALYFKVFGQITNDLANKSIFAMFVEDGNVPDDPPSYSQITNQSSSSIGNLYYMGVPGGNVLTWLQKPDARIRIKLSRDAVEFYDIPIKLKEIDPSPTAYGTTSNYEAITASFKIEKL